MKTPLLKDSFLLSLVIPVYNEEELIADSVRTVRAILDTHRIPHEFILVDDGSRDGSWATLEALSQTLPRLRALRLSRNFGKEAALCAGLEAAEGDACVVMDADLQHPPEVIPEMVRLWRDEGYEVVEGVKADRGKEGLVSKVGAFLFYRILEKLSGISLRSASDFKLLDAKVVDAWKQLGERNTFFRGMAAWVGYRRAQVPIVIAERKVGVTKWSFLSLFKLSVTAITAFSSLPLQIVTFLGVGFLVGAFPLAVQTLAMKVQGLAVDGFTTVILLLLIIGSALMISLGIIGTYIAKIFDEVKGRPRYLVSRVVESSLQGGAPTP